MGGVICLKRYLYHALASVGSAVPSKSVAQRLRTLGRPFGTTLRAYIAVNTSFYYTYSWVARVALVLRAATRVNR
jgi:hypothetical protein